MGLRIGWALGALVIAGGTARAQPSPEAPLPAPEPPPAPSPEPAPPFVDPRMDPAWQRYHHAFALLAQGDRDGARAEVAVLQQMHPDHPATRQAENALASNAPGTAARPAPRAALVEQPTNGARAELALFQGIHGIHVGIELCLIAQCDDAEPYVLLGLVGGIAGTAASLTRDNIRSGTRALVNSGTVWGAFNAGMILINTDPESISTVGLGLLAGQGLGIGAALALETRRPTAGQVALANSGGQWALALTGLLMATFEPDIADRNIPLVLMAAGDAGIGVGAYLASRYPWVSRAQTLVLDAGGIVGGVAGGGLGVMLTGSVEDRTTYAAAAVGIVAGLGAAAYLTRNWRNDDALAMRTALAPVPGGGAMFVSSLDW
ncbi:MAG: hypothetical protein SFX73_04390 [Kofleriaceae bacterium]|nr:hypothetical protein [Kofleriaceae bacterium]